MDGRQVSRTTFSDLYYVISINWGAGDLMTTFHLPDLRGMFIRGVDYTAGNDPNKITRNFQHTGGNSGNNIGSLQEDAFQGHKHQLFDGESSNTYAKETVDFVQGSGIGAIRWCSAQDHNCITAPTTDSANGTPRTTSETRPKNVYVNYIIKY
ncbi:MAG: tail fiber protein [Bacteroidia bacterium]|nr:tail fiber protein [Bacteroidia bacterium]